MTTVTVNDIVWFTHKQVRCVGRVARVVKSRKLIVVEHDGKFLKGPFDRFRNATLGNQTLNLGPIWGVVGFRRNGRIHSEVEAFTATITLNGRPVLRASNDGSGSCNSYIEVGAGVHATNVRTAFHNYTKKWNNGGQASDEFWIHYMVYGKAKGLTPEQFRAAQAATIDKLLDIRTYDQQIADRQAV